MNRLVFITAVLMLINLNAVFSQECNVSVVNYNVENTSATKFEITFELSNNSDFAINLYDETDKEYLIDNSNIFPTLSNKSNLKMLKEGYVFKIKDIDMDKLGHNLALVLVSKTGECKPFKIELK